MVGYKNNGLNENTAESYETFDWKIIHLFNKFHRFRKVGFNVSHDVNLGSLSTKNNTYYSAKYNCIYARTTQNNTPIIVRTSSKSTDEFRVLFCQLKRICGQKSLLTVKIFIFLRETNKDCKDSVLSLGTIDNAINAFFPGEAVYNLGARPIEPHCHFYQFSTSFTMCLLNDGHPGGISELRLPPLFPPCIYRPGTIISRSQKFRRHTL